ncbi:MULTISPECIES: hydrogenase maturation nickel metallochaperone HypA [Methanobacterium]|jgi:hydrogenase nickel incorporation protein HypA/HybF|uniref:Hydrogenase maturation factor HypA n=1 Tax=Methanobacterium formicicum TaxID=2162 RepID=A0A090I5H8_METFO|nr:MULTISPECIES: hydrogenase maturation nickel metallochaperone HypA [Methanobacterium]MBF4474049.1 hydrogenase maturation nickel metallochaperone HypA [Methanobacterium formicicum]MDG3546429.1 hydrogenase maturation nickel metallochaperone HypA [Methanobacterium formicicum]MDH2659621.1 hydrogenase maturation nickel metallochaperone HypA [Methanobacterium formicicum]CEA14840.1 hydrogenase nickel incorporation protein HypA [Methanobacterium formicicum]
MHELSMAQAIVDTVLDAAEKNNATEVVEVTIEVGMLTMLNPEQLKFLLDVIVEDTLLADAEIIIEDVPVEIDCRSCDYTGLANTDGSDHYLSIVKCPQCDERNVEILTGKECNVKTIKIEKE